MVKHEVAESVTATLDSLKTLVCRQHLSPELVNFCDCIAFGVVYSEELLARGTERCSVKKRGNAFQMIEVNRSWRSCIG